MSFFEQMDTRTLPKPEEAEVKLDLRGVEKGAALEKLDAIVTYCTRSSARTLYIAFDPVKAGAGQTLFQPLARYIAMQKSQGVVQNAVPLMTETQGGLYVTFRL
jgi:hypothetical protein